MVKKSLIFLFCFLFLTSFASAFEFDNIETYINDTSIVVENAYGLPFISKTIGNATVLTGLDHRVARGYGEVQRIELNGYENYEDVLKEFEYFDLITGNEIERQVDLFVVTEEGYTKDDYYYNCYQKLNPENNSYFEQCDKIITGNHTETREILTPIGEVININENEKLIISLWTEVYVGDKVDLVATIFGERIEGWAVWTEDLNTDLLAYWKFDEQDTSGSGTIIDELGTYNGTNAGADNSTGKIETAYDYDGSTDYIGYGNVLNADTGEWSTAGWFKSSTTGAYQQIVGKTQASATDSWEVRIDSNNRLDASFREGSNTDKVTTTTTVTDGNWHFFVFTRGTGGNVELYLDDESAITATNNNRDVGNSFNFRVGRTDSALFPFDGVIDEIGIWDRKLTSSEVEQLYNNGTGISYTDSFGTAPSVTLTSPVPYANLTAANIDFVTTVTDDQEVDNVTLYVDGVLNETNSSGVNGTYTFSKILSEGIHNWSILAINNNSIENQSETRFFNYTFPIIPPVITLTSPVAFANLTSANVDFITTVTDNIKIENVTLYLDGIANETNSSGVNGTYTFSKMVSLGEHNWSILAYDNNSFSTQSETRTFNYTQPPIFIDLLSPADASTHVIPLVNMSCKAYEEVGVTQLNLTIDGVTNISITNTSIGENLTISQEMNFSEGNYTWGCSAMNNMISATSANRTFEVDYADSVIVLFEPENDSSINNNSVYFIFNASNPNGVANATIYINDIQGPTLTDLGSGNYSFNFLFDEGNYTWYIQTVSDVGTITNSSMPIFEVLFSSPVIADVSPVNDSTIFVNDIYFNFSATDSNGIDNVTLYIDGVLNETNSSGVNGTYSFYRNLSDGNYNWSVIAVSIYGKESTIGNYLLDVHTTGPIVNVFYPIGTLNFTEPGTNLTLNYSVGGDNVTSCWYEYGEDGYCFQESFNISNQTGLDGDCGLNYTGEILVYNVGSTHIGYYNYTKPINATSAMWQIRYGIEDFVNVTIPTGCYYNDNDYLELSIDQNFNSIFFSANCYDGSSWVEIYNELLSSATGGFTTTTNSSIFNDGDYTTGGLFTNPLRIAESGNFLDYQLYEEAMYWNIGTQLNCSEALANFTYEFGYNNLTVSALDALGALSSNTTTWDYLFENWDIGLVTPQYEGTQGVFTLNTTLKTGELIEQAIFEYNGTNYSTSIAASGSSYIIVASIALPSVENDTNFTLSFYVVVDGITYNFKEETQEVLNIGFITCVDDQDLLINLSLFDEGARTELFGDVEFNMQAHSKTSDGIVAEINGTYENISNQEICLSPNASFPNLYLNAEFRYFKDGYATEFYHIQKADLTDYPIDLDLFSLNQNDSTEFTVTYKNNDFIFTEGAVIQLQRKYVGENIYRVVEAPITGDGGTAILHIDLDTNKYQATVVKDGELLDVFPNIVFSCDNELSGDCSHSLDGTVDPNNDVSITEITDFSYSVSIDEGNQTVTVLFTVPSGTPATINVVLEQIDMFGNLTSCNTTLVTSAGSITCDYTDTIEKSILELSISKNNVELSILSYVNDPQLDMDGINFFIIFLFMISIVGMAIASPEWMVIISVMVLVIGGTLLLINGMNLVMGLGALAWVIVAAAIMIFKMAKQEDR